MGDGTSRVIEVLRKIIVKSIVVSRKNYSLYSTFNCFIIVAYSSEDRDK